MKWIYLPAMLLVIIVCGCHKGGSAVSVTSYTDSIANGRTWDGQFSRTIDSRACGTDTTINYSGYHLSVIAVDDTTLTVTIYTSPAFSFKASYVYNSLDGTAKTVSYRSTAQDGSGGLVYYYQQDSVSVGYSGIAGSNCGYDDVYNINYGFHSVR